MRNQEFVRNIKNYDDEMITFLYILFQDLSKTMEQLYFSVKYQDIKFAPLNPSILGVLSNRDIQIFRFENQMASQGHQADPNAFYPQLKLQQIVEIGQVTTFEWQRCQAKNQMNQYILAAHQNGKISLINALGGPGLGGAGHNFMYNQPYFNVDRKKHQQKIQNTFGQDQVPSGKIEKVFITSGMVQNSRHCNALAWNPVNPKLFAAGYDRTSSQDSSLMIWDIERSMNQYLNRVRIEEEQSSAFGPFPSSVGRADPRGAGHDADFNGVQGRNMTLGKVETSLGPKIVTEYQQAFQNITEDIYSIAWLPESEHELIYATENQIQFCDTRQSYNHKTIVAQENQGQIFNIKFDPFNKRRFAAMAEDQVLIFDLRAANQLSYCIKSWKEEDSFFVAEGMQANAAAGKLTGQSAGVGNHHQFEGGAGIRANSNRSTFSGFNWCLNRENLIATFSKRSSRVRFWDLVDENKNSAGYNELIANDSNQMQDKAAQESRATNLISKSNSIGEGSAQSSANARGASKNHNTLQSAQSEDEAPVESKHINFQNFQTTKFLSDEYKVLNCKGKIVSLAWKPKNPALLSEKNKFVIYTNDGQIQELVFYEKSFNVLAFSSKGEICISVQNPGSQRGHEASLDQAGNQGDKKYNLQTINLNENRINFGKIDHDQLLYNYARSKRAAQRRPEQYDESPQSIGILKDISNYILKRIEGGYHLDTIDHNCRMVTRFCGAANLYCKASHRSKKSSSTQAMTEQLKGIKTFWNWLKRIKDLSNKDQDDVLKSRSSDEAAPLMSQMIGGAAPQRNMHASLGMSSEPGSFTGPADGNGTFSNISILSDGIAGLLSKYIEFRKPSLLQMIEDRKRKSKDHENNRENKDKNELDEQDQIYELLDQEQEMLYGNNVFTSQIRQQIIDFCGWTDVIRPRYKRETDMNQQLQQQQYIPQGRAPHHQNSEAKQDQQLEHLGRCCERAKGFDGYLSRNSLDDHDGYHQDQKYQDNEANDGGVPTQSPILGVLSRISIMACLHFDFCLAAQYLSNTDSFDAANQNLKQQYAEDETIKMIFSNILNSLKDIQTLSAGELLGYFRDQMNAQTVQNIQMMQFNQTGGNSQMDNLVNQKVLMVQDMNKNMHLQMKNPYFETFFKLIDKNQRSSLFDHKNNQSSKINFLDYITIMCRFLDTKELEKRFNDMIKTGIVNGNLEVIALIGLNSPSLFPLLQYYVDRTSDIQTAAYISAYAINIQRISGLVPKRSENKLSKFITAYRDFLNNLQMWNTRAVFDVKLGQIVKDNAQTAPKNSDGFQNYKDEERKATEAADGPSRKKAQHEQKSNDLISRYAQYVAQEKQRQMQSQLQTPQPMNQGQTQNQNQDQSQSEKAQQKQSPSSATNFREDIQAQYKDLYGSEIYSKRPFENQAICYFCSESFSLKKQLDKMMNVNNNKTNQSAGTGGGAGAGGVNNNMGRQDKRGDADRQKTIIHQCACKKLVPNCAVCLKPMDMLNPYLEFKKQQNRQSGIPGMMTVGNLGNFGLPMGMNLNMQNVGGMTGMGNMASVGTMGGLGGGFPGSSPSMLSQGAANQLNPQQPKMGGLNMGGLGENQALGLQNNMSKQNLAAVSMANINQPGANPGPLANGLSTPGLGFKGLGSLPNMQHPNQVPQGQNAMQSSFMANQMVDNPNLEIKLNQAIGNWMTWCQTCKHGGHAQHISEWFLTNTVCPVSDCRCECSRL